jgi:hypothetical protein
MWTGQATVALTSWADKEIRKMRLIALQNRLEKEKPKTE